MTYNLKGASMKVIAYCRVSTADQSDHGVSLDAQREKTAAYAALYDLTIIETIIDAGESAKSLDRLGLQRALSLLKAGQADGLLIVKLDRLTRSVADWQTLIDDYFGDKVGKQLLSVNDSIDTAHRCRSPSLKRPTLCCPMGAGNNRGANQRSLTPQNP